MTITKKIKKNKKGFTLLETILVLGIAGVAATLALQEQARNLQTRIADISGAQIAEIGKATNAYMVAYYSDWNNGGNASDKSSSDDGGPRNCNSSDICTISISTLVNNGFLSSWNPNLRNPFRSPYEIVIKRNGAAGGMPILNALIVTEDPYIPKAGGEVSFDLLGRAIQTAGAQAGFSRNIGSCSDTSICGYGGSFTVDSSEYSNVVTQEGQLGFYTGVTAGQGSGGGSGVNDDYLLRDGTLPMTGNLNMDSNDIENVRRINGTPNSGLRMSAVRISDNPADLPAVNAAPEFSTAANVPSTFRGSVTIDDANPSNSNYIAVFRQNITGNQREFEIGSGSQTRFNNQDEAAVEIAGGINFADNSSSISNLGRGPDSQSSNYSDNTYNFTGLNKYGNTPVLVNDSLSVAGVITNNSNSNNGHAGVRIADSQGIDLSTKTANTQGITSYDRPIGTVTVGGYNSNSEKTNLKVNNGALYVGGDEACNSANCDFNNPETGRLSVRDLYVKNYWSKNFHPKRNGSYNYKEAAKKVGLSELIPSIVTKGIYKLSMDSAGPGAYNHYVPNPECLGGINNTIALALDKSRESVVGPYWSPTYITDINADVYADRIIGNILEIQGTYERPQTTGMPVYTRYIGDVIVYCDYSQGYQPYEFNYNPPPTDVFEN